MTSRFLSVGFCYVAVCLAVLASFGLTVQAETTTGWFWCNQGTDCTMCAACNGGPPNPVANPCNGPCFYSNSCGCAPSNPNAPPGTPITCQCTC